MKETKAAVDDDDGFDEENFPVLNWVRELERLREESNKF